jgi:O-6-methylguanine DNA methyltransferase
MADELRAMVFEALGAGSESWGWVGLAASPRGLRLLTLPVGAHELALRGVRRHYRQVTLSAEDAFLLDVAGQVQDYFAGRRQDFAVELDLRGHTTFELSVWAVASKIAYGETRSYGWIAGQVGGGLAVAQAVGAALGSNPVPLIIPCHRVIGSDGSLHGFAGGLALKARLLALENHQMALPF